MQLYKSSTLIKYNVFKILYPLHIIYKIQFFFQLCSQMEFGNKKKAEGVGYSKICLNSSALSSKTSRYPLIPKLHLGMQLYKSSTLIKYNVFKILYPLHIIYKIQFFFQLCSQMEFGNKKKAEGVGYSKICLLFINNIL